MGAIAFLEPHLEHVAGGGQSEDEQDGDEGERLGVVGGRTVLREEDGANEASLARAEPCPRRRRKTLESGGGRVATEEV